jgi:vacuolar-type H+-ATPase subunit H
LFGGGFLIKNTMQEVLQAEETAENILQEAKENAQNMLKTAKENSESQMRAATEELQNKLNSQVDFAQKKSREFKLDAEKQAKLEITKLKQNINQQKPEIINQIINHVFKQT